MISIRNVRPLSIEDKKRDLSTLISWGRSLLDPPPAVGATKPPKSKLSDAGRIRPQNPPIDRGDGVALKIVASIDPDELTAKIAHLREHGNCSSWVWASTGAPGKLAALPGPMAPSETETVVPCRETFERCCETFKRCLAAKPPPLAARCSSADL